MTTQAQIDKQHNVKLTQERAMWKRRAKKAERCLDRSLECLRNGEIAIAVSDIAATRAEREGNGE